MSKQMMLFELDEVVKTQQDLGELYWEFLRVPALSMGVYTLDVGATDPQQPHSEDEIYLVQQGRAKLWVDGKDIPVQTGSIIYVAAYAPHYFHQIEEQLTVLVFFAPAEQLND